MYEPYEETVIAFIPSLVATLLHVEREKGAPLTVSEVLEIRDNAPCRAIRPIELPKLVARRGYEDIDPERCW